jgi:uncharacterized protein YkwD
MWADDKRNQKRSNTNMQIQLKIVFNICLTILLGCTTVSVRSTEAGSVYYSPLEKELIREINLARTNPLNYASFLEESKQYYDGKLLKRPGEIPVRTKEGVSAVNEAIYFLRSANSLPPLTLSRGMSLGAKDHVRDIGPVGAIRHEGSDGSEPWDRVNRYGTWQEEIGEGIFYGSGEAREIVMNLIIDDGVSGRGHRKNIFNPDFRVVGVGCGYHDTYRAMCVITLAGGYVEKDKK